MQEMKMTDKAARLENDWSEQNKVSLAIMSILQYCGTFFRKTKLGCQKERG